MFEKDLQVSNGGSTTSSLKLNISLATYFMEVKPVISNWHELLHNGRSQRMLKSFLFTYSRSIPYGRTLFSTTFRQRILRDRPLLMIEDLDCSHWQYMDDSSPRLFTAIYIMEIKPILSNWYKLLHYDCSQAEFELTLSTFVRSIPHGRTFFSTDARLRTLHSHSHLMIKRLECNRRQDMIDNSIAWAFNQILFDIRGDDTYFCTDSDLTLLSLSFGELHWSRMCITPDNVLANTDLYFGHSQQEAMMLEPPFFSNYLFFPTCQDYPSTIFSERQHQPDIGAETRQLSDYLHSEDGECSTIDIAYADDLTFLAPLVGGVQRMMDTVDSLCLILRLAN